MVLDCHKLDWLQAAFGCDVLDTAALPPPLATGLRRQAPQTHIPQLKSHRLSPQLHSLHSLPATTKGVAQSVEFDKLFHLCDTSDEEAGTTPAAKRVRSTETVPAGPPAARQPPHTFAAPPPPQHLGAFYAAPIRHPYPELGTQGRQSPACPPPAPGPSRQPSPAGSHLAAPPLTQPHTQPPQPHRPAPWAATPGAIMVQARPRLQPGSLPPDSLAPLLPYPAAGGDAEAGCLAAGPAGPCPAQAAQLKRQQSTPSSTSSHTSPGTASLSALNNHQLTPEHASMPLKPGQRHPAPSPSPAARSLLGGGVTHTRPTAPPWPPPAVLSARGGPSWHSAPHARPDRGPELACSTPAPAILASHAAPMLQQPTQPPAHPGEPHPPAAAAAAKCLTQAGAEAWGLTPSRHLPLSRPDPSHLPLQGSSSSSRGHGGGTGSIHPQQVQAAASAPHAARALPRSVRTALLAKLDGAASVGTSCGVGAGLGGPAAGAVGPGPAGGPAAAAAEGDVVGEVGGGRWGWLGEQRRDGGGRAPGELGFDPTTITVPEAALRGMTGFVKQFWAIKARAMDLVLFCRHGSFYNLFDVDADVGMRVGLALSGERKANMWKCGCTKDAFPAWAAKVLALGYSVGRVEEVHSRGPRSAQAAGKGGAAGNVLERRLVRVYTPGTMTHAHYFDDVSLVPGGSGSTRPLVALVEGPAGALGVAVLDAALGQVQVGQLEAGSGTGGHLLSNLLLRLDPAEVVAPQTSLSPATLSLLARHSGVAAAFHSPAGLSRAAQTAAPHCGLLSLLPLHAFHPAAAGVPGRCAPSLTQQVQGTAWRCQGLPRGASSQPFVPTSYQPACQPLAPFPTRSQLGTPHGACRDSDLAGARSPGVALGAEYGEAALAHCRLLLQPLVESGVPSRHRFDGRGDHESSQVPMGPQALLALLHRLVTSAPLAVQAAAVLLQHLQRCCALPELVHSATSVSCLEQCTSQHHGPQARGGLPGAAGQPGRRYVLLDHAALTTLELLEGVGQAVGGGGAGDAGSGRRGSLLDFLDLAANAMGRRRVRQWICRPLAIVQDIEERLQVVELFMRHPELGEALQGCLARLPDLERLLPRAAQALDAVVAQSRPEGADQDSTHDGNENDDTNGASWAGSCLEKAGWRAVFQLLGGLLACLEAVYSLSTAAQQLNAPRVPLLLASTQFAEAAVGSLEELLLVFDVDQDDGEEAQAGSRLQLKAGAFPDYDAACQEVERLEGRLEESWTLQRAALVAKGATPAQARRMEAVDEGVQGMAKVPAGLGPMLTKSGYQLLGRQGACVLVQLDWLAPLAQLLNQAQAVQQLALRSALSGAAAVFSTAQPVFTRLLDALAQLDALAGMAVATRPDNAPPGCTFCRPHFTAAAPVAGSLSDQRPAMSAPQGRGQALRVTSDQQVLDLQELWHPLLLYSSAPSAQGMRVTPNTLQLGSNCHQSPLLLLTGPNMGGKSTLLRATCVATIMAHLGCYVPAAMARLAPVDCIFTRMGAHDRIMAGESTFRVEMAETAAGLAGASPSSLLVLDELGRGTATHDGLALAYAVLRHLADGVRCRSLFATHYQELTCEPALRSAVVLAHMAHEYTAEGEFKPLHALRPGAAPEGSNGIAVAALAGLPPAVTERARIHSDRLVRVMQERQRRRAQRMGHAPNDACEHHGEVMRVVAEVVGALKRLAPSSSRMVKAQGLASLRLAWQRLQA